MKFMLYINMYMIIIIMYNKNISPLNFMMSLILFTLIYLILNYLITQKSLYCFMIFISMISGNMIMFLYFTSLINNYYNKSFKSNLNFIWFMMIMLIFITFFYYFFNYSINIKLKTSNSLFIYKTYTYPLYKVTFLMIFYLLITLLFSMKICLSKYKPLRKIIN
uniref:NADH dehydrogenase subunit 6 n=1 Tax=Halictus rubicundus TaxID=77578 RepID=A0A0S2LTD0_HALRI|nr:NADH dehydrogenase subunit 6 [Halictus rubicundus]